MKAYSLLNSACEYLTATSRLHYINGVTFIQTNAGALSLDLPCPASEKINSRQTPPMYFWIECDHLCII